MEINFTPNSAKYVCNVCHVNCSKKSDWERHINTIKHCHRVNGNKTENMEINKSAQYKCVCGKKFVTNSGLWKHNKVCTISSSEQLLTTDSQEKNIDKNNNENLINYLIKENQEFKNLILEIVKKDTYTTNTTTNNTNSHNKAFNLNFFLNETCKDAMNIMDFVDSIQYQLADLEKMGEIGYVEGLSNIIVKNLNALDVTQRPVHCTDKKRETIYIKDQDKWEKDEDKNKIRKAIKRAALKNARLIQKFKEKHPDYNEYHSKYSTQYHKLIIESFGGSGDNDVEKEDKIIRNITKNIVVDKDMN